MFQKCIVSSATVQHTRNQNLTLAPSVGCDCPTDLRVRYTYLSSHFCDSYRSKNTSFFNKKEKNWTYSIYFLCLLLQFDYFVNENASPENYSVTVRMSSCSQCHQCLALLYDEDIMAGWAADDSNLNTRCIACGRHTVPLLSVQVLRSEKPAETLSVPYLNPLVLRKEFESILGREGDACLADSGFVESHPIVYWNLVWFLERANIENHLPDLLCPDFQAKYLSTDMLQDTERTGGCRVICAWEWSSSEPGDAGVTLQQAWRQRRRQQRSRALQALLLTEDDAYTARTIALTVLNGLLSNDLTDPLRKLATWRENTSNNKRYHSFYRDILFLAMAALGEHNIDLTALQREYSRALEQLGGEARPQDLPPSNTAVCCRHYFKRLRLLVDE